ncbi:MAG TPA: hypothetical protein VF466_00110 [Candidatus Saccharimonadales bacterium]
MPRAVNRVRSMDAPLSYADMEAIFVRAGSDLLVKYGGESPLPPYYPLAAEFIGRCLNRLADIEQEWGEVVVTSLGAVSASVRMDMRDRYGDPHFNPANIDMAVTAMEGAGLGREMIASAYLAYP